MSTFIILPLYYPLTDELFYRVISVNTYGNKNAVETLKTISIDKFDEEGKRLASKEYELFRMTHLEDNFIEIGRIPITESYYQLIKLNSDE
jgi:hypothetical protein